MALLATEKTKTYKVGTADLVVTYKIPTSLDVEEFIQSGTKNSELIRTFVKNVKCTEYPEIDSAEAVLNIPGGLGIVTEIAADVLADSRIPGGLKNA